MRLTLLLLLGSLIVQPLLPSLSGVADTAAFVLQVREGEGGRGAGARSIAPSRSESAARSWRIRLVALSFFVTLGYLSFVDPKSGDK